MKIILFIFLIIPWLCSSQDSYTDSLNTIRKHKQEHLQDTSAGTLKANDLEDFKKVNFFKVDTKFIVKANWEKKKGRRFKMPTSTDREPIYRRYGYLNFIIEGKNYKLTVYQNMGLRKMKEYKNYFFIPFYDETSGITSYGGGRYLDAYISKKQTIVKIDFNLCYNPYCAYSHRYSCPIPPIENTLEVEINAGEKTPIYHTEH